MINRKQLQRSLLCACLAIGLVSMTGCLGGMAQLLYVIKGHKTPAAFDGMQEKKVAVVVLSDATAYGPDTVTYNVSKMISMKLAQHVKKIDVVPPSSIENYMDSIEWDQADVSELGREVEADMVLLVELGSYTIHDGATLYKGQSELTVSVHDVAKDQVVFSRGPMEYVFPKMGRPSIQTSDRQFEAFYLSKLTDHVSKLFYSHDALDSVAEDAAMPF